MKKILLTIILLTGIIYSQDYAIKDTVVDNASAIREHAQAIIDLASGGGTGDELSVRLTLLEQLTELLEQKQLAHEDSITAHRLRLEALEADGGGGIITPSINPHTTLVATADNDTAKIGLTWTSSTSPHDSTYVYRIISSSDVVYTKIATVDSGVELYSNTSLLTSTGYTYYISAIKWVSGILYESSPSNTASATTYTPEYDPPVAADGWTFDYIVSATGDVTGNGDTLTLDQALAVVVRGDTVQVLAGSYEDNSISFNDAGVVWVGVNKNWNSEDCTGDSSTVINTTTLASNDAYTITANAIKFYNIVFKQDTPDKYLINISDADSLVFDSCSFKYPSNSTGSNNHFMVVRSNSDHGTMSYCHWYHSPRTGIWIQGGSSDANDYWTLSHCTFKGMGGHPSLQVMPYTAASYTAPPQSEGFTMEYCRFEDITYADIYYLRHCNNFKVVGNLFIDANRQSLPLHAINTPPIGWIVDTSSTGLFAFNTQIIYDASQGYFLYNEGTQRLTVKNNLVLCTGTGSMYGNYWYRFQCHNTNDSEYPPTLGHDINYNLYYADVDATFSAARFYYLSNDAVCGSTTYTFANWKAVKGFDLNSTIGQRPTFTDESGRDFSPLNASSPQVGIGTWDTKFTTQWNLAKFDINGNAIDTTNVTIGAIQYVP